VTRPAFVPRKNQAGLEDRPVWLETDFVSNYALRFLRSIRIVLAPKGSSSNASAIIVVGSGRAVSCLNLKVWKP
jgi:hypothetical protein